MTFSFPPHRSLSDDDALDQHLNTWASGNRHSERSDGTLRCSAAPRPHSVESPSEANHRRHSERSEESPHEALQSATNSTADALEFHRWADDVRRTDPAATGPAAGTWNRVLRNSAQAPSKGKREMSTAGLRSQAVGYTDAPRESAGQLIRHYSNLAATIALVLAVAVGGWLAMSQMPGGSDDSRFAAIQGSPEVAQTCDVEPMTVNEVMAIVENPYKYAAPSDYGPPNMSPAPWFDDVAEVQPITTDILGANYGEVPTDAAMERALPVLDSYMACMETATVAHALRFVDPFSIQRHVTEEFPFYRDESGVRDFVTRWISGGPYSSNWVDEESGETLAFWPNTRIDEARTRQAWMGLGFNQILFIGSNVLDENGTFLARYDATMNVVEGEKQDRFMRYTLVYSMYTEQWYVVIGMWPYNPRI